MKLLSESCPWQATCADVHLHLSLNTPVLQKEEESLYVTKAIYLLLISLVRSCSSPDHDAKLLIISNQLFSAPCDYCNDKH